MLRHHRCLTLLVLLCTGAARAEPGFVTAIEAHPAWEAGPPGAFHPVGQADGRTIHVDAASGNDANSGAADAPLATIGRALELAAAGDTVLVHPGTYREQILIPDKNPAPSRLKPLVIRAEPADGQSVVIDGSGVDLQLEGTLQNPAGVSLYRDGAVIFDGFAVENFAGYGVAVQQSSDTVIRRCRLSGNGTAMADPVDLVVISAQQVRVWNNVFAGTDASERALDDRATDTWIAYNRFSGYPVNAVLVGPHPAGAGSRIEHNDFRANPANQGVILVDRAHGVTLARNLLAGGALQGIRLEEAADCQVLNNTVTGFQFALEMHFASRCRIAGNIFAANTVGLEFLSAAGDSQPDENLYFDNTADSDGLGEPGPQAHFADPGFRDPQNGDYCPAPGAYPIDRGPADLPVPQGGGARTDLGACEQGAGDFPWHYQPQLSVADLSPEFTWTYQDGDGGSQAALRVQLDPSPSFDSPALIDSNYVLSASGAWIVPDAFALTPGTWYLRIKTRDQDNHSGPWSHPWLAVAVSEPPECASQGGRACDPLDACNGDWLVAADSARCCSGSCQPCPDSDGDGFQDESCGGTDCDDTDDAVHPDAGEDCQNGRDDDCDGASDLDDDECGCIDHDRDGYGVNCPDGPDCDDTIAAVHPGAEELCNNTDDDCDGDIDEGFNLLADPDNCGECGWVCRASAGEVCDRGSCQSACGSGRSNCNRWCLDTSSDLANCGGCGVVCQLPHAAVSCSQGQCLLTACQSGWVDLDGSPENGCEYACSPAAGGQEVCGNGSDDDCDGLTDEDCGGGCSCGRAGGGGGLGALVLLLLLAAGPATLRRRRG